MQEATRRLTLASLGDWDFRPALPSIRAPSLVVEGAATPLPLDAVRVWAALLPDARLLLIPGAGHAYPFVERPDVFFPSIEDFLEGRWPSEAEAVEPVP